MNRNFMRFGIEIEILSKLSGLKMHKLLQSLNLQHGVSYLPNNYQSWYIGFDGSLKKTGYYKLEIISPVMTDFRDLEKVLEALQIIEENLCINESCSMHIHISDNKFQTEECVCELVKYYIKNEHIFDEYCHQSRADNPYCTSPTKIDIFKNSEFICDDFDEQIFDLNAEINFYHDRNCKINLNHFPKRKSIEFRQHECTLDSEKIINWINMLFEVVEKCCV